jgi:hypothetical protein
VDDVHAFFGSQNFTNYSIDSIEISTQIDRSDGFDSFFAHYDFLLNLAREVTVEELNEAAGSTRFSVKETSEED